MDLSLRTDHFDSDDASWLGSSHGTDAGRSITLDVSTFTEATHYPDGYFPSGLPLGRITASGLYGPYDSEAVDGRATLAGFLLAPVDTPTGSGDVIGALLDHGRVKVNRLPVAFDPATVADNATTIVFDES